MPKIYVRPISMRFVRGRSTPEIRAMSYPCRCLCFWFVQITRTTPRRRTTLHLSQIRFTDALTFIHASRWNLFHDSPAPVIPGRQLQSDLVAHEHPDERPARAGPRVRRHLPLPVDDHAIEPARQRLGDRPDDGARAVVPRVVFGQHLPGTRGHARQHQRTVLRNRHRVLEVRRKAAVARDRGPRSEEHTSELQSLAYLVCRLLLEKKTKRS